MTVQAPTEPTYYFECSFGDFRLSYFIPVATLETMVANDVIRANAMDDFPDGVDLDCTEPDFEDFQRNYGYRPPLNADLLRDSFLALYSTTQNWESFHGTGFVKASDLEGNLPRVEEAIAAEEATSEPLPTPEDAAYPVRRANAQMKMQKRSKTAAALIKLECKDVVPNMPIKQQAFTKVQMSSDKRAEDVFQRLHQNRN